ncbi:MULTISPECIES: heat shock protein HslJ [Serratia]|jgi:heat shock protein HslJ|uniref:Heat shock protein hslJ n=1 Tax=Serratia fonticola TaxID=47917 RepID=A0A0F7HEJ0_SERFO|nr:MULTISPECIES: heat shock protein HslJ [Serratia]AKG71539.1 heat-inducible protein [Serratia fonticola]ALX95244.1 heat-inducible protein [Serratia fonticola]MBC3251126.1 heat shock protein HslJ [Serratia fonticola]MBL5828725.1 heat shock protein HslJ [Serratia fonticola]MBL5863629.1 heat shock protein HslJ [Serratia fonticola]
MKKLIPLAMACALLAGCGSAQTKQQTVVESDLLHHNFVLQSVDGVAVEAKQGSGPSIEFGEKMNISGSMCNRFFGQGQLENGVLTVKNLATTRMMCADPQRNQWDQTIGTLLANGAKVSLNGQQLTLSGSDHQLVYTLKDWVN